jgi:arsenite-transporting ATPase
VAREGWFAKYLVGQDKYMEEINESFAPLPIFKVGHLGEEVFGLELLEKIGEQVYGDQDPTAIFHNESPFQVKEEKDAYIISIRLPFVAEEELELKKFGDELVLNIGNRRRNIFLPRFANFLKLESYRFEAPWLRVKLTKS